MHPIVETRARLVTRFTTVLKANGYADVDVFNWWPEAAAKSAALVLGDADANLEINRLASSTRIPFSEEWTINTEVRLLAEVTDDAEAAAYLMGIVDLMITALASDTTLGNQEGLIRCVVENVELNQSTAEAPMRAGVDLFCEYRIGRERL